MNNYIFDCVQVLRDSLEQDSEISRDVILTIIAEMVMDVTESDVRFPLNDRIPPLTEMEVEFGISEVDDLNFTNSDDYSCFYHFRFSHLIVTIRMYRKDSRNRLVQFELSESDKLTFLSNEQMTSLLHNQTLKCIFKLDIPNEIKVLSVKAVKDLPGEYQNINQMIQDILTYEHELKMESAEIQLYPDWQLSKWKYHLSLWIPTLDGENDSLCKVYEFDELDVLQELFGKEFVLISMISQFDFKFRLDTTS